MSKNKFFTGQVIVVGVAPPVQTINSRPDDNQKTDPLSPARTHAFLPIMPAPDANNAGLKTTSMLPAINCKLNNSVCVHINVTKGILAAATICDELPPKVMLPAEFASLGVQSPLFKPSCALAHVICSGLKSLFTVPPTATLCVPSVRIYLSAVTQCVLICVGQSVAVALTNSIRCEGLLSHLYKPLSAKFANATSPKLSNVQTRALISVSDDGSE